jgi:S-adenosylmethionine decarboxylase
MAYDDALFQLGMDLTRSSTAQKEDHGERAQVAQTEASKDFFAARKGVRSNGTHLVIDLLGARRLDNLEHIEDALTRCIEAAGATLLHVHLHYSSPQGDVSGVALLADGNAYFCSWPGSSFAQITFFSRGSVKPERALVAAADLFQAREAVIRKDRREQAEQEPASYAPPMPSRRPRSKTGRVVPQPSVRAA